MPQQRVGDFYVDDVLPALAAQLDTAFPEFGWKRDGRGWVATNEEMTHDVLGVRAERVVAHGPAPRGFLVHGGDPVLWTAYLNGGVVPRGETFRTVVRELAQRAGVDMSPVDRPVPRDRGVELLDDFYRLCRAELRSERGATARAYLEGRGFQRDALVHVELGLVPSELQTKRALEAAGYAALEVARSGVIADGRWPGRLCGAWRDEQGRPRTFWARSLRESDESTRYLYLRGASRSGLPPYGLYELLRLPSSERQEIVLVEGLVDVHHLRSKGFANVAALGGARLQPEAVGKLLPLGFDSVVLAFDNDAAGRDGLARALDLLVRTDGLPATRVLDPERLGASKDPDAFVRSRGVGPFRGLVDEAGCGITWRARDLLRGVDPGDPPRERRAALARAGEWLGALPAQRALEQEDAIRAVADQCGYSRAAVERAFRARFWPAPSKLRNERHELVRGR